MVAIITVAELRQAFQRFADDLEGDGIDSLEFDGDLYWYIVMDEALEIYKDPKPAIGDYTDDVNRLLSEPKELGIVSYNFIQSLASIIQNAGAKPRAKP